MIFFYPCATLDKKRDFRFLSNGKIVHTISIQFEIIQNLDMRAWVYFWSIAMPFIQYLCNQTAKNFIGCLIDWGLSA